MKKNTIVLILALIIIAAIFGFIAYQNNTSVVTNPIDTTNTDTQGNSNNTQEPANGDRMMSIEDYVRSNISKLSSEKEVLGGTFYVTEIEAQDGAGAVSYEDGHNAFTADFTYTTDENKGHTINTFVVRK